MKETLYGLSILIFISNSDILLSQSRPEQLLNALKALPEIQHDSIYYDIYAFYKYNIPDTGYYYAQKVYELSKKYDHKQIYVKSLHALGYFRTKEIDFISASNYYQEGLDLSIKINYQIGILIMLNDIGLLYLAKGQNDIAFNYFLKVIQYAQKFNQPWDEAIAYNNISSIYVRIKNYNEAINYEEKCISIKEKNGIKFGLATNYCNVGICNLRIKNYSKAYNIFSTELIKCKECDLTVLAFIYSGLSSSSYHLGKYHESEIYLNKSILYAKATRDYSRMIEGFLNQAEMNQELFQFELSKKYIDSAYTIINRINDLQNKIEAFKLYSSYFKAEGIINKALQYLDWMISLKDSVFFSDQYKNIQNSYIDFRESQSQLALLEKEFQIKKSRQIAITSTTTVVIVLIILIFSYRALILRKRLSEKLNEMVEIKTMELSNTNKMLIKSRQELDTFLYRTSHDIRGPIATLMGLASVAKIDGPEKITPTILEKMDITTGKVNEIITRLNNVSQIHSLTPEFSIINLKSMIEEMVQNILVRPGIEKRVQFKLLGNFPEEIKTDKILIHYILNNLLENSFQFYDRREDNPEVELQIIMNQKLEFTISDNGTGINPEIHDKIFDLFFSASVSHGSGLGLYQAKAAVIKLGGVISLINCKKPTIFRVILPYS